MSAAVTVLVVLLVTFALVASALPVFAAPASAGVPQAVPAGQPALLPLHARLVSTAPADGARVPTAQRVTLTFSEDVDPRFLVLRVSGPGGDETQGSAVVRGRTVTQPLVPDLAAGAHTVAYRVVSVDGHAVAGTLAFTTTIAPPTPSASPDATSTASPSASPSAPSAIPAPTPLPSPSTAPAAAEAGVPGWLWVAGLVVLLVLVGAAAAWRTLSRPPSVAGGAGAGDDPGEHQGDDPDGSFRG
ncbi:hypothetical protein ATL31_1901 [Phycicoccus duodecadis]|uniref:CopC domain-containing protein n=2 Tax=Phycicoccus duodecadis TaxID=173053 RepID=A0A2N3YJT6_9MICO|nr:hypothetical protein ATL31_1901 [Phycicoccus duodecadis]